MTSLAHARLTAPAVPAVAHDERVVPVGSVSALGRCGLAGRRFDRCDWARGDINFAGMIDEIKSPAAEHLPLSESRPDESESKELPFPPEQMRSFRRHPINYMKYLDAPIRVANGKAPPDTSFIAIAAHGESLEVDGYFRHGRFMHEKCSEAPLPDCLAK